ncbi:MAG: DUF932 domain-containing protein [Clostridiales bacterium]|nr:DUF932 domain-containing protein [Clostridiales bacterium]
MSAEVETMFYTREKPWHGLGVRVEEAPSSEDALIMAGLNWRVVQRPIMTEEGIEVPGYRVNLRKSDNRILGIVTDRYRVVQNEEAFAFTDALIGEGVTYETAGSLQEGKRVWLLAKLPEDYVMCGDAVTPYLVFMNSFDGTGAIKVAMTPVRVVCQNTLNLALSTARRTWSAKHTGDISGKMEDARNTLLYAGKYMDELKMDIERLNQKKLSDRAVYEYIDALFPLYEDPTELQLKNLRRMKEEVKTRFFEAPDLQGVGKNAYRFVNAVSDFATHSKPLRTTANYRENLFARTIDGNAMIDRAYELVSAA